MQLMELGAFFAAMIVLVVCGCIFTRRPIKGPQSEAQHSKSVRSAREVTRGAADRGEFLCTSPLRPPCRSAPPSFAAWRTHKDVFEENAALARGKQSVTPQAANFATLRFAWSLDRDDLIFGLATWTGEGGRL